MSETSHLLPHLDRLVHRIELLETPLVQVWGWPGSGKSALLNAFLAAKGGAADAVSLDELAEPGALRGAVDAAYATGVRWLVANGDPRVGLREAARRLRPGQHLVFAGERRVRGLEELPGALVAPQELLTTPAEIGAAWRLLTGDRTSPQAAQRLHAATDGWYRPLRFALEATGGAGLEEGTAELLVEIGAVRSFLRHEVLETFSAAEQEALLTAPEERAPCDGWALLEERGLWVDGGDRDRMPRLLAAFLERERRRRGRHPLSPTAVPLAAASSQGSAPQSTVYLLGLLGASFVRRRGPEGERDLDCRLRRSFQVLAFLASSPGLEAGREEIIEAVWPSEGERTIERNFHPTLSHLRRALESGRRDDVQPLLLRSGVYRLNPEIEWEIDSLEFSSLVERGRGLAARGDLSGAADAWRRSWSLYRGPFLQGHYEAWATARREVYQRQQLDMLRDLGDLWLRLQRPDQALDAYRSILVEDPLQERIHVALMHVYADQGRRDMVRRQYDRLCTLLLDELGVEPLPETTREYHRLMG